MPQIRGEQIVDESITNSDIKDGTITGADIADNAISSSKIDTRFKEPVTAEVDLPILNNTVNDIRLVSDLSTFFFWDGEAWKRIELAGSVISNWTSYTPTFQGFGTPTNVDCRWRRVGTNMEIKGEFNSGTPTAVEGRIYLPSGYTTPSDIATITMVGSLAVGGVFSSNTNFYVLAEPNKNYLTFGYVNATSDALTKRMPNAWASTYRHSLTASVPISGWTSSTNLVTEVTEYASNSSSTNADDLTSFVNEEDGSVGVIGTTALTAVRRKRIRFKTPITNRDLIYIELFDPLGDKWIAGDVRYGGSSPICNHYQYASASGGITYSAVAGSDTDLDINFHTYPYGATSTEWNNAAYLGGKWRVRKVANGNNSQSIPSGIYESKSNANGYYIKFIDGTLMQWVNRLGSTTGQVTKTFNITWPVPFSDTNYTMTHSFYENTSGTGVYNTGNGLEKTTTGMSYAMYTSSDTTTVCYADFFAVGKWNNALQVYSPGALTGVTIEESDSNSNGAYIKLSDGTLIQYGTATVDFSLDTWTVANLNIGTYGWSYYTLSKGPFTLPTSFIDGNYSISAIGGSNQRIVQQSTLNTTGFTLVWHNYAATSSVTSIKWFAIGKWK